MAVGDLVVGRTSSEHPVILSSSVKSVSPEPQSLLGFCGSYSLLSLLSLALTPCLFSLSLPSQYRLGCGLAQAFHLDCLNMFSWFVRPLVARPSKTGKPSSSHCGLLGPAKYESEECLARMQVYCRLAILTVPSSCDACPFMVLSLFPRG